MAYLRIENVPVCIYFFFVLNNISNPTWKVVPFRISTADDTVSGKNTGTFKVCNYFLFIDPTMLSVTTLSLWSSGGIMERVKKSEELFFCYNNLNTKRRTNFPLKAFYPLLTKSFLEHYCQFYFKNILLPER